MLETQLFFVAIDNTRNGQIYGRKVLVVIVSSGVTHVKHAEVAVAVLIRLTFGKGRGAMGVVIAKRRCIAGLVNGNGRNNRALGQDCCVLT